MKDIVKTWIYISLVIIIICIIDVCLVNIILWKQENTKTEKLIININDEVEITTSTNEAETINDNADKSDPYWDYINVPLTDVDFTNLLKINNETVGWVNVKNTNVNYPIVKHTDNNFYLNHSFDQKKNSAGWVYMDYRNNTSSIDKNTIIYAHGRLDGSMFGSLKKATQKEWLEKEENHIINFSTTSYNSMWQIFSIYKIEPTDDYLTINFNNDDVYNNFLTALKNRSIHNFNTDINPKDNIITLSTCYDDNYRLAIHAKLIKIEYKN